MAIERRLFLKRIGLSLSAIPFLGFLGCKKKIILKPRSLGMTTKIMAEEGLKPTTQAIDALTQSTLDIIIKTMTDQEKVYLGV